MPVPFHTHNQSSSTLPLPFHIPKWQSIFSWRTPSKWKIKNCCLSTISASSNDILWKRMKITVWIATRLNYASHKNPGNTKHALQVQHNFEMNQSHLFWIFFCIELCVCVCVEVAAGCTVLALAFIFSNASNINKHPTSPSTTKSIVTPKKGGCLATSQTGNNKHVKMPRTSFKLRRKEKLNCHKILRAKLDKWLTYKIF